MVVSTHENGFKSYLKVQFLPLILEVNRSYFFYLGVTSIEVLKTGVSPLALCHGSLVFRYTSLAK